MGTETWGGDWRAVSMVELQRICQGLIEENERLKKELEEIKQRAGGKERMKKNEKIQADLDPIL